MSEVKSFEQETTCFLVPLANSCVFVVFVIVVVFPLAMIKKKKEFALLTVGIVLKSDFAVKNFDPAFSLLCTLFHLTDIKHSKLFIHLFMLQTAGSAGGDYAEALQL